MRSIQATQYVDIMPETTVTVDRRVVTVKGPRGTLVRAFKHIKCEMKMLETGKMRLDFWWLTKKEAAVVRTVCSHIKNMMIGVIRGYKYTMKSVYAHFPINIVVTDKGKTVEIRNFLGEKIVRTVKMYEGCVIANDGKDQIKIEGNDIELVSLCAARVQQSTTVKNKDIRKFLDGIYVSDKANVVEAEE